jgi:hypothetical protein
MTRRQRDARWSTLPPSAWLPSMPVALLSVHATNPNSHAIRISRSDRTSAPFAIVNVTQATMARSSA